PVAHEESVHVLVGPWAHAHDLVLARLHDDVAPLSTVGADRGRTIELPGASLVQEVLGEQRAYRAEIDHVGCPRVRHVAAFELADERPIAARADVERWRGGDIVHKADTARAENAAVRNVDHVAAEILGRIEALGLAVARIGATLLVRIVLQLALARLVANRTIERMVDEEHL